MHALLEDTDVLVVDCQTTGATPDKGHLLELGWARVSARRCITARAATARLIALPEGAEIPRQVARITGITAAHLHDAHSPESAWSELLAAARALMVEQPERPPLTVIHYARFEMRFLRWLQDTCDPDGAFPLDVVCTHEIARKLLPDLPRRGLRALAGYFGASPGTLRRSASHVAATSVVWQHLAQLLVDEGVRTDAQLRAFLERPAPRRKRGHRYPMDRGKRLGLPDRPGVYHMLRGNGDLLYVGKAKSLARRVNSYFQKQSKIPDRTLEMLTQARDLQVQVTHSALEAALLEHDQIKELAPPYNVALQDRGRSLYYASPDFDDIACTPSRRRRLGPMATPHVPLAMAGVRALLDGRDGPDGSPAMSLLVRDWREPPDEEVARAGVALFRQDYLLDASAERVRGALAALGGDMWRERLLAARLEAEASGADEPADHDPGSDTGSDTDPGSDTDSDTDEAEFVWDPPAVARMLARAVRRTAHALRRAHWLCQLSEASIAWRVPGRASSKQRLLLVHGGAVVECADTRPGQIPPIPGRHALTQRQRVAGIDACTYERLRVLTTELRRLVGESEYISIRLGPARVLDREALRRTLAWV